MGAGDDAVPLDMIAYPALSRILRAPGVRGLRSVGRTGHVQCCVAWRVAWPAGNHPAPRWLTTDAAEAAAAATDDPAPPAADEKSGQSTQRALMRGRHVTVHILSSTGNLVTKETNMADLRRRTGLHLAELLLVDRSAKGTATRVVVRENCIIVNVLHVRALIFAHEVCPPRSVP